MDEHDHESGWAATRAGKPESADPADQDHWRARRLRKNIDDRRRQHAEEELVLVGGKNGAKKHARDATSLRALQVKGGTGIPVCGVCAQLFWLLVHVSRVLHCQRHVCCLCHPGFW